MLACKDAIRAGNLASHLHKIRVTNESWWEPAAQQCAANMPLPCRAGARRDMPGLMTQRGALRGAALPAPCRPAARVPAAARPRSVRVAARKLDKRSIKKVWYGWGITTCFLCHGQVLHQ